MRYRGNCHIASEYSYKTIMTEKSDLVFLVSDTIAIRYASLPARDAQFIIDKLHDLWKRNREIPRVLFDLMSGITKVIASLEPDFQHYHIRLHINPWPENTECFGDPGLFEDAIRAVIQNAIDALATISIENKVIKVGLTDRGDYYKISIQYNGSGIAAELQTSIMQPWVTTKPDGSGLAMAHYTITGKFGGTITFESRGGITEFTIKIIKHADQNHLG